MADIPSLLSQLDEKVSELSSVNDHEYFLKTDYNYQQSIAELSTLTTALFN